MQLNSYLFNTWNNTFRPRPGHPRVHIEVKCTNNFIMLEIFCVEIHQKITLKLEVLQQLFTVFLTNITLTVQRVDPSSRAV